MRTSLFRPVIGVTALVLIVAILPAGAADPVPDNKALLIVKLPADATLRVGEHLTRQTGSERHFITPSLPPGKEFSYTLKAVWTQGGQNQSAERTIAVRAGQRTEVDLRPADTTAQNTDPKPAPKDDPAVAAKPGKAKERSFLFTYGATVTGLAPDQIAKVWLPVPSSSEYQDIEIADTKALPEGHKIDKEAAYGNRILFAEVKGDKDGNAPLAVTYKVTRREAKGATGADVPDADKLARYLEPDQLVPIEGKPLELIKDKAVPKDQSAAGKLLYDLVNSHMRYSKEGTGWGRGDAVWACDSKYGNCTDFHSLFISLARSQKIPAKFEMGFSVPTKRGEGDIGGYHCWAFFKPEGKGWVPVDISEANKEPKMKDYYFGNLTEDRVGFSTGRDFDLVPKQEGAARNYFIYPYVEVDGKEYAADKVKRKFSFKDVPQ